MQSTGQPPEAPPSKSQSPGSGASTTAPPGATGARARNYPQPPSLPLRLLFFCLKPESWPAAARFPTRYTFTALALAILIVACAVGIADSFRFTRALNALAVNFPPMEITSAGIIKPKTELHEPITRPFFPRRIIIDPSNKTTLDTVGVSDAILVTDHDLQQRVEDNDLHLPLANFVPLARLAGWLPSDGATGTIDAAAIHRTAVGLGIFCGAMLALCQLLTDALWIAIMLFFLTPLITLTASMGERSLLLPKRATYRMAAALLTPLVVLGGLLRAADYSVSSVISINEAHIFWFLAACALALWTGIMARSSFGPRPRRPARQN